jgi:gliding motility-associated-like protein
VKENNNIEELFKQKFEGFEGNVDPSAWTNIQQGINSAGASGATSAGLSGIAKVAIIAGVISVTAVSVWYFSGNEEEALNDIPVISQNDTVEENSEEPLQTIGENILVTDTNDPIITNNIVEIEDELGQDIFNPEDINSELVEEILGVEVVNNYVVVDNEENNVVVEEEVDQNIDVIEVEKPQVEKVRCDIKKEIFENEVEFTSNAKNHSEVEWMFGDGHVEVGDEVSHEYGRPGTYNVKVLVKNIKGTKVKEVNLEVVIEGTSRLGQIPNTITPNNDGANDYFNIESEGIETFYISIVGPMGKEVFTSQDADFEWDGRKLDGSIESGRYIYTIIAQGEDGQIYKERGALSVH